MIKRNSMRTQIRWAQALAALLVVTNLDSLYASTCFQETGANSLKAPIRLEADGEPIDIGKVASVAHAGPWVEDIDGDGDRDLLVGDFPGYFWYFENTSNDQKPVYTSRGKLQAGGEDAKTPVY